MRELAYPFQGEYILKKKKLIRKQLLGDGSTRIEKRIAVLGGSTTRDIVQMLELFLLDAGIEPVFYQCEFAQYWEDVMFDNPELKAFQPDIVYIHTTHKNIREGEYPLLSDTPLQVEEKENNLFQHFSVMWDKLLTEYHCQVIQNNFEMPDFRLLGNMDAYEIHGRRHFITEVNRRFYEYAQAHSSFHIQDIEFLAADYGLAKWNDPFYWHMYKYSPAVPAIPMVSYNLAGIIKAIYGKSKKALVLDLDNTLWGGIVGDDGADKIEMGQESSVGQIYAAFQQYLKLHKQKGILLNVNSKNEMENALAGLSRDDSVLKPEDFIVIKANWNPKDMNLREIAQELNLGTDAFVFVDDNPAERHRVASEHPGTAVPEITDGLEAAPEHFIRIMDRAAFFEAVAVSQDDLKRNEMYQSNAARASSVNSFTNYTEYLESLEMKAEIKPFSSAYMQRIAQLTNKSNQFNLTTKRCSLSDIEGFASDENYITLYGRLTDRFGDNGVVSVVFGHKENNDFHIDLWLMSCRVLKRNLEHAMLDMLVEKASNIGLEQIYGYYYPTAKNAMVKSFYTEMGFDKQSEDEDGNVVFIMEVDGYEKQNYVIQVNEGEEIK